MINYFVIGTCLFLLIAVIFIAAKPISMGIEARRNIKDDINNEDISLDADISEENNIKNLNEINSENIIRRIYQFLFYQSNAPRSKKTRILISEMKKLNFNIFNVKGMIVKKNDDFLTFSRKSV